MKVCTHFSGSAVVVQVAPDFYIMKPFDLEAAKRGEPIQTRDGTPVQFIAHVPEAVPFSVVVLIDNAIETFKDDGTFYLGSEYIHDLFMAPKKRTKRTVWVNLYPDRLSAHYHSTEAAANTLFQEGRIGGKAWPLEIEE